MARKNENKAIVEKGTSTPENMNIEMNGNTNSSADEQKAALHDILNGEVVDITVAEERLYSSVCSTIEDCQRRAEGLVATIATQLYIVEKNRLYRLEDCKSTAKWAEQKYGIAKSTVSEALKVMGRFGTVYGIADKWKEYKFASLVQMAKLSEKEIEDSGISPSDSRAVIKEKIKALESKNSSSDEQTDSEVSNDSTENTEQTAEERQEVEKTRSEIEKAIEDNSREMGNTSYKFDASQFVRLDENEQLVMTDNGISELAEALRDIYISGGTIMISHARGN